MNQILMNRSEWANSVLNQIKNEFILNQIDSLSSQRSDQFNLQNLCKGFVSAYRNNENIQTVPQALEVA